METAYTATTPTVAAAGLLEPKRASRRPTKKPMRFREDEENNDKEELTQSNEKHRETNDKTSASPAPGSVGRTTCQDKTDSSSSYDSDNDANKPGGASRIVAKRTVKIGGGRSSVKTAAAKTKTGAIQADKNGTAASASTWELKNDHHGSQTAAVTGTPAAAVAPGNVTNNLFGKLSIQKPRPQLGVEAAVNHHHDRHNQRSPAAGFLDVLAEQAVMTPRAKDNITNQGFNLSDPPTGGAVTTNSNVSAVSDTPTTEVTRRRTSFLQTASGLDDAVALYHDGTLEVEVGGYQVVGSAGNNGADGLQQHGNKYENTVPMFAFQSRPDHAAQKDPGCLYHIDNLHPCDVLVGRGATGRNHTGNLLFRHMVQYLQPTYTKAPNVPTRSNSKRDVAECLVGEIQKYGGRFLYLYQGAVELGKDDGQRKTNGSTGGDKPAERNETDGVTVGEWWYELDNIKAREKASQSLRSEISTEASYAEAEASLIEFYNAVGDRLPGSTSPNESNEKLVSALRQMQGGGGALVAAARRRSSISSVDNLKQLAEVVMEQISQGIGSDAPKSGRISGYEDADLSRVSPNSSSSAVASIGGSSPAISPTPSAGSKQGSTNGMDLLTSVASADYALPTSAGKIKKLIGGHSTPLTVSSTLSGSPRKRAKTPPVVTTEKQNFMPSYEITVGAIDVQYSNKPDGYEHLFGRKEFASSSAPSSNAADSPKVSSDTPPTPPTPVSPKSKGISGGGNANRRPSDAEAKRLRRANKPQSDVRSGSYPFPYKLFELIENASPDICGWTNGGRAFIVHNHEEFRQKLLPVYFGHNVMRSFVRQLSYWAFDKLSDPRVTLMSHGGCMWTNQFFQQGRHDLLKHIERVRVANKRKKPPTETPASAPASRGATSGITGHAKKVPKLAASQKSPKVPKPKLQTQALTAPPSVPSLPNVPAMMAPPPPPTPPSELTQDVVEV